MSERLYGSQDMMPLNNRSTLIENIERFSGINSDVSDMMLKEYAGEINRMNKRNLSFYSSKHLQSKKIQVVDVILNISRS